MRSASFSSRRARCAGVIDAHGRDSKALRAACTAASMSASPPAAARANTRLVGRIDHLEGLAAICAACQRPPMNNSRGCAVKLAARCARGVGNHRCRCVHLHKHLEIVNAIAVGRLLGAPDEHVAVEPVVLARRRLELRHRAHVIGVVGHRLAPRHLRPWPRACPSDSRGSGSRCWRRRRSAAGSARRSR